MKAPGLADLLTVRGEVLRPAIAHKSLLAEMFDDLGAPRVIIPEGKRAEFSGFFQHPLGVQELVCQFQHPQTGVVCFRRNSPGLQIFTNSEIFPLSRVRITPNAKIVNRASDLFAPLAVICWGKWKIFAGLVRFLPCFFHVGNSRFGSRHKTRKRFYQCGAVAQSVRAANS